MDYGYLYPTHYGYHELVMVHFINEASETYPRQRSYNYSFQGF